MAVILYRLMQSSRAHGLGPLGWCNKMVTVLGGCVIGRGAFGPGPCADPLERVVINGSVKAAAGCTSSTR
jgi:hypothetical protein